MDERGANIDLVFRNGLKDFEVLPPPEVWDNIHPVIKRKQRPFILIRAAALITLVISISFLTYRLSREKLPGPDNTVIALNEEAASPSISSSIDKPITFAAEGNKLLKNPSKTLAENIPDKAIEPENKMTSSPDVAYLQETKSLSMNKAKPLYEPPLASLNSSRKNTFKIKEPDEQFLPWNSTIKGTGRWSIAAMASPTYYSKFNSDNSEISKQLMASEQPLISYSGGVAFSYKINKRFSIQSGLYYSSLGQKVEGINSFGGFQKYENTKGDHNFEVLTTNGSVYTNNADVFLIATGPGERILTSYTSDVFDPEKASLQYINNTLRQFFSYVELPIVLRYKVVDKAIDINLIGGVSYNLLVNNSVYTMVDGGKYPIGTTKGLNPVSLSSSLGMGMEYNLSDNLSLNLEPTFRYYLNPFNEVTGSKIHPYSFGIFSGVSYKF
ncbi:MAG: outer membrane beta-barrel protein [Bacteroidia bacterium]|nr:outer membrane beta-barrel protein [Bacteroidia bacterium]